MRHAIFVAAIALGLIGTGCAQIPGQQAVEKSAATAVSNGGQSVTIPGLAGQNITVSGQVPDALKGFPVPDGFTLDKDGYGSMSSKEGTIAIGSWSGTATTQTVFDFYSKTMTQQGWTEQMTSKTDSGGLLTYTKGDSQATVTVSTTDKPTKVTVMVGKFVATPTVAANASTSGGSTAEASPTPNAVQTTSGQPAATETAAPPNLNAGGAVPAELSSVPVPSGFKVISDSGSTVSAGGKFTMATVRWFGTTSVADVGAFYKNALAADWTEVTFTQMDENIIAAYTSKKDPKLSLAITASKTDAGTEVAAVVNATP